MALLHSLNNNESTSAIINTLPISNSAMYDRLSYREMFGPSDTFTWSNTIPKAVGYTIKNIHPLTLVKEWPEAPVPGLTHWVIPGRLLAGGSLGGLKESELMAITNSGIDTFVSLQTSYREYVREDYRSVLRNITALNKGIFPPHEISFLHCPIDDHDTLLDNQMWEFIEELSKLLEMDNRSVYIHCYGGHGRTGTVLSILLQYLFGVDKNTAMETLLRSHETRRCIYWCSLKHGQLEDRSQENQVLRLEKIMYNRQLIIRRLLTFKE
jgi:hypothetical protein